MAKSPDHYIYLSEHGETRIEIRYIRPFRQTIRVKIEPKDSL